MTNRSTYENRFEGAWLVSEYVYTPSGEFSGVVRQTRKVSPTENGRIQVTQNCMPSDQLYNSPMASFRGEHVFDLVPDGHARRYLGPAVIGSGLTWGEGAMTGRGLWPSFGHNFTSFAVMSEPEVQLTGGKFFTGTEMVANIVGIAEPQTSDEPDWPRLEGETEAWVCAENWQGKTRQVNAQGKVLKESTLHRSYSIVEGQRFLTEKVDDCDSICFQISVSKKNQIQVLGEALGASLQGLGKAYGWLTELELCLAPSWIVEWMEVLDARHRRLVGIRRWWNDSVLDHIDVVNLSANEQ